MDITKRKITKIAREAEKLVLVSLREEGVGTAEIDLIHALRHNPGGKKLCGILTEAVNDYSRGISEYLVIGIGINVMTTPVVPSSSVECTSLSELGSAASREELCAGIARELISMRDKSFDFSLYSEEYAARSVVIGREITFTRNGETRHGTALGIDKHGGLIVCSDNETLLLDSGEISVRLKNL